METKAPISAVAAYNVFQQNCPSRRVFDLVGERWAALVLLALHGQPQRFSALRRRIEGISQKMLTQTVRQMERDGLLTRTVHPVVPPKVEYKLTQLGLSLGAAFCGVWVWAAENLKCVEKARRKFDEKARPVENYVGQRAKS